MEEEQTNFIAITISAYLISQLDEFKFTIRLTRFPLLLRGCRNDDRCNLRVLLLIDRTRRVARAEPLSAKRLSVLRFVAIK